jgi:hypothetical protein
VAGVSPAIGLKREHHFTRGHALPVGLDDSVEAAIR